MHFLRLWAVSALAALCAILAILSVWLLAHVGFDVEETMRLILSYVTNAPLVLLAMAISALIGLIEAAIWTVWHRARSRRA